VNPIILLLNADSYALHGVVTSETVIFNIALIKDNPGTTARDYFPPTFRVEFMNERKKCVW
jgi:hypothetical protein